MRVKRAKIRSQSLASRIAGLSALGFGISWKAPEPERVVVRDVITALEDKRALYSQAVWEEPHHVVQSLFNIRDDLTAGLKRVGDNSPRQRCVSDYARDVSRFSNPYKREGIRNGQGHDAR